MRGCALRGRRRSLADCAAPAAAQLGALMSGLRKLAEEYNVAVVITNQVGPYCSTDGGPSLLALR